MYEELGHENILQTSKSRDRDIEIEIFAQSGIYAHDRLISTSHLSTVLFVLDKWNIWKKQNNGSGFAICI